MAEKMVKPERGVQYPGDHLEGTIQLLEKYRSAIGLGVASRETVAEALGYRGISGTSARRIGSMTHYGLLERSGAGAYKVSDLGKKLLMPRTDAERSEAIVEAAKRPKLFAILFEKYSDNALPSLLPNLLVREHGVAASVADAAAKTFRETAEFAGLLQNGILKSSAAIRGVEAINSENTDVEKPAGEGAPLREIRVAASASEQDYTVALDGTGRIANIRLPVPVTTKDIRRIRAWTDYMTAVLGDTEEEPGGNAE